MKSDSFEFLYRAPILFDSKEITKISLETEWNGPARLSELLTTKSNEVKSDEEWLNACA